MSSVELDPRKTRLYQYMLNNGKLAFEDVPAAYQPEMVVPASE